MKHTRRVIRDAVVDGLQSLTLPYGAQVVGTKFEPNIGPAGVNVYGLSERVDIDSESPRAYKRELDLEIEVWTKAASGAEGRADDIALLVERWMAENETLDGVCEMVLRSVSAGIAEEGQEVFGMTLTYGATYVANAMDDGDPRATDEFEGYDIDIETTDGATAAEAVTVIQ